MIQLLDGVRVVECAVLVQGDHTGKLLGDMGADVTKVEAPGVGDYLRDLGGVITPRNSPPHLVHNRNKRSLSLNLRQPEGRQILFDMVKTADIFIDGFAGDACARLGIGYEDLRKVKPDLIYCQSSGFGAVGEYANVPVHGYMMMSLAGALHIEMDDDGFAREKRDPEAMFHGSFSAPIVGALFAALAAVGALHQRQRTGQGAFIDASGADAALALRCADAAFHWNRDRIVDATSFPRIGHPNSPKYDYYQTKDGRFLVFAGIEPKFWRNFCRAIDRPDLAATIDETFAVDFSNTGGEPLARELQTIFHGKTLDEWMEVAREFDVALGPANTNADLLKDPHLRAREIVYESVHPHAGPFKTVGWPAPIAGQPFEVAREAPLVGEQTDEVLAELGRSSEQIDQLRSSGVI